MPKTSIDVSWKSSLVTKLGLTITIRLPSCTREIGPIQTNQPPLEKIRSLCSDKHMLILFFSYCGVVYKPKLEQRQKGWPVTDAFYEKNCLKPLLSGVADKVPEIRTPEDLLWNFLHHDNAPSHTVAFTNSFLWEKNFQNYSTSTLFSWTGPCDFVSR